MTDIRDKQYTILKNLPTYTYGRTLPYSKSSAKLFLSLPQENSETNGVSFESPVGKLLESGKKLGMVSP